VGEITKGWTCCEQPEFIKRIESVLVIGFLQYPLKPWKIEVMLEYKERLFIGVYKRELKEDLKGRRLSNLN
jgi:hypothetical protein